MAALSESIDTAASRMNHDPVIAGGIAGFFAGAMFGAMMSATTMMENVAALIGMESLAAGWMLHFLISILVALLYVGLVSNERIARYAARPSTGAGLGVVYGITLWIVGVVYVMPLWLGAVTPATPTVPNLEWMSFVGHLIYGVFLGALYPLLRSHDRGAVEVPPDGFGPDEFDPRVDGEVIPSEGGDSTVDTDRSALEPGSTADGMNVFSAEGIRDSVERDEIPLGLVLASIAVERILIETIADELDIAADTVPDCCGGEGLENYVRTVSILDLYDEHEATLQALVAHRNDVVRQPSKEHLDGETSEERRAILDVADFVEHVEA